MEIFKESACAKVILFGEHAVVYGQPAIAIPVSAVRAFAEIRIDDEIDNPIINAADLKIRHPLFSNDYPTQIKHLIDAVQLLLNKQNFNFTNNSWELKVWSQIPIACGLGSSAAIGVAIIRALFKNADKELNKTSLLELSYELEKYHHGRPSGIDNTVISLEKPVLFQKEHELKIIEPKEFYFVIGDTGIGKKTAQVVAEVGEQYKSRPNIFSKIFQQIGDIAKQGFNELQQGNKIELGRLMNENHTLLKEMGVSCAELNDLCEIAINNKALGAKLCGAGQGGCMVALAYDYNDAQSIKKALIEMGAVNSYISLLK